MNGRQFITLVGGAAVAWPLAAHAQQAAMPVIGFLSSGSPGALRDALSAFHQGLSGEGFFQNLKNVTIEYRWAEGDYNRLPSLAAELVRRPLSLIVAMPTQSALAAQAATASLPIVFYTGGDPIELGLVTSFNRPGRNLTGVSQFSGVLGPKRLELVRELVPTARKIAVLVNPDSPISEFPNQKCAGDGAGAEHSACYLESQSRERDRGGISSRYRSRSKWIGYRGQFILQQPTR